MTNEFTNFDRKMLGTVLQGRFEIVQQIGSGGMGSVFLGRQLSIDRDIAIKVLRPGLPETSKKRFLREAKTVSGMSHPGIVQIIDFGEHDDIIFIAMELVQGTSLQKLLNEGRIHPRLALEIVDQAAAALGEAHRNGVVHRDLKPSNIVVGSTPEGRPHLKLLDFGIAFSERDPRLTQSGTLCGTPAYMAPEQAQGRDVSPQTDIYSLGIVLYQLLSGRLPFYSQTPLGVLLKHLKEKAPSLGGHVAQGVLPDELVELAAWMMKKEIRNRPPDSHSVREALQGIREGLGSEEVVLQGTRHRDFEPWILPRLTEDPANDAVVSRVSFGAANTERMKALDTDVYPDTLDVDEDEMKPTTKFEPITADDAPRSGSTGQKPDADNAGERAWAAFAEASEVLPERQAPENIDPNLWDASDEAAAFSDSSIEFDVPARFFAIEPQDTGPRDSPSARSQSVTAGIVPTARNESLSDKAESNRAPEKVTESSYELEEIERPRPRELAAPKREQPELKKRHTGTSFLISNIIFIALIVGLVASMAFVGMELFVNQPERQRQEELRQRRGFPPSSQTAEQPAERGGAREPDRKKGTSSEKPRGESDESVDDLPWKKPIELYQSGELEKRAKEANEQLSGE